MVNSKQLMSSERITAGVGVGARATRATPDRLASRAEYDLRYTLQPENF